MQHGAPLEQTGAERLRRTIPTTLPGVSPAPAAYLDLPSAAAS